MKTELDITKIMDDYTDNEFGIEGEQAVDTEKAVGDLLKQVQPKKKIKPLFKVLMAAAAAVMVCLTAVVGFTYVNYEWSISGASLSVTHKGNTTEYHLAFDGKPLDHPVKLEDGRIIFTYEDEETDVTDLIDEETPFIYTYTNPEGLECYIIVGGTVDDFGYANVYDRGNDFGFEALGVKYNNPDFDDEAWLAWTDLYRNGEMDWDTNFRGEFEQSFRHWFINAWDQLGYDGFNDLRGHIYFSDYDEIPEGTYSNYMGH